MVNNSLQTFKSSEFGELGVVLINGREYFPATECARMLGYSDPFDAIKRHTKGSVRHRVLTPGGEQEMNFIPEGDLYRLIVKAADQSRNQEIKAKAERFERWIFDEVLPTIREHGLYATDQVLEQMLASPEFGIRLLTELKDEREKRTVLEQKIKENEPLIVFAETALKSSDNILVRDLAKVMCDQGINIGEKRLYGWLRQQKMIMKGSTKPYQSSLDQELFVLEEKPIKTPYGEKLVFTTKVTPKGQVYIIEKYKERQGYKNA